MTRALSIDIGTNTVLGAVGEVRDGALRIVHDAERIVGLGRGVDASRRLRPDRIEAALDALGEHVRVARDLGVTQIAAVGTSALRDAANADELLTPARRILGGPVEVVSGEREAKLTFAGALVGLPTPPTGPLLVFDIGGGSTELVWGEGEAMAHRVSIDVGSVRLYERHLKTDPPREDELRALDEALTAALSPLPTAEGRTLVALAGTASSVAMLVRGEIGSAHGTSLTQADARRVAAELSSRSASARRSLPGMIQARADVLVAGARILIAVLAWARAERTWVSEGGVRYGVLRELFGR